MLSLRGMMEIMVMVETFGVLLWWNWNFGELKWREDNVAKNSGENGGKTCL